MLCHWTKIQSVNSNTIVILQWFIPQKTSTCCLRTGSQEKRRRAWWGNRWSTLLTRVWRGRAWWSTRSQPSPQSTTSNTMMTFISMSTTWSKPPRDSGHFLTVSSLRPSASVPLIVLLLLSEAMAEFSSWRASLFGRKCNLFFICTAEL